MRKSKLVKGFTLIELLVVIAIIALLLSIVMPALARVKNVGKRIACLNTMRQWGVGAMAYASEFKDALPWEGDKTDLAFNFTRSDWWANAIPPRVAQEPYKKLSEEERVPMPPDKSMFICPSAKAPESAPYPITGKPWYRFFFCYVWNSDINEGRTKDNVDDVDPIRLFKLKQTSDTIFMLEMRTSDEELPEDDPYYGEELNRHRADWKRFAARHDRGSQKGGNMVFCDGHADFVSNEYATTSRQGNRGSDYNNDDWNKSDLIWNPFGPAYD